MHRSLLKLNSIFLHHQSSTRSLLPTIPVRSISTSEQLFGAIQMKKQTESKLLDTSRDVEGEDGKDDSQVALSKDRRVFVCWHPEVPFPYEHTKPIPMDMVPTESTLKVQALAPVREIFRQKHKRIMIQELMQLTYTSKYPWYLNHKRPRLERYKKMNPRNTERYREYL